MITLRVPVIDWTVVWLFLSFGCFLCAAIKAHVNFGRLTINLGWLGLAIWTGLALAAQ